MIRQGGRFNQSNCIWDQDSGESGVLGLGSCLGPTCGVWSLRLSLFCICMANSTDFLRFFLVVVTDCPLIEPLLERQQKPWDSNRGIVSTWWMRRLFSSDLPSTVFGVAANQRQKGKDKPDLVLGPLAFSSVYKFSEAIDTMQCPFCQRIWPYVCSQHIRVHEMYEKMYASELRQLCRRVFMADKNANDYSRAIV